MFNRSMMLLLVCYLVISSVPSMANAKPSAPVDIDNITPEIIQVGEEVRSVIRFTPKTDLRYLKISLSPYSGIELLSSDRYVELTGLQRDNPREIEIRIRLTNETGYLSVFATTTDMAGNTRTRSVAIRYNSSDYTPNRKSSRENENDALSKKLILLPGSPR